VAAFALPDTFHRDRCREVLPEVAAALAAHFGGPVDLRLLVESEVPIAAGAVDDESAEEVDIDLSELRDAASPEVSSPVDRLLEVFEGATVVEEQ
jgi:hypothetical protein